VETSIDSPLPGNRGASLRILHEHHGTHRGYGSAKNTLGDSLGSFVVSSPVIGVHNQDTGASRPADLMRRFKGVTDWQVYGAPSPRRRRL